MSSSKRQKKASSQAGEDGKQSTQAQQIVSDSRTQQQQVVFGTTSKSYSDLIMRQQVEFGRSSNLSSADVQPKNSKIQTSKREPRKKIVSEAKSVAARLRWEKKRQDDREKKEHVERAARLQFEQQLEIERRARIEEDMKREQRKSEDARLRQEKKRQRNKEKQEQVEREAKLKFEQQLEIERQAIAEEDTRREREQQEYNERLLKAQLARESSKHGLKARKVEGQRRRRLNEKEQEREKERKGLLNIRSKWSGNVIEQREIDRINSPLDAQASAVCVGEVNLRGEPQTTEQLIRQQTQSDNNILDDKEYKQRVMVEKQRQTQLFSQQPCTQYILVGCKARKNKAYNERKKAERASKKEPVQKVKSTKQVSSTRSAANKARRATEKENKAEMERMDTSGEAVTVQKLDLVPKARVLVQPETLYASLTKEEKYKILLRRGKIKEQVMMGQQDG
ncbi:hypothetical protein C5167_015196, partial [Papaver somniferum]